MQRMYDDNRSSGKTGIVLKQVNVKSSKIAHGIQLAHSANMNGAGHADFILMGDKLGPGCVNILDCLKGRIPGVRYQDNVIYSMHTHYELSGAQLPMAIIVDGQISDQSILETIDPNTVYSIEVLQSVAYLTIYGSNAAGGALVITTKQGGEFNDTQRSNDGTIYYTYKGFYKAHTFYLPKYSTTEAIANKPDTRSTIYWNPELLTDKDGNASFDFYNADGTGTYRVVVEGIDENGNLGRRVYHYTVK
jgi:TonB-dependent Receptor Plug Domain